MGIDDDEKEEEEEERERHEEEVHGFFLLVFGLWFSLSGDKVWLFV